MFDGIWRSLIQRISRLARVSRFRNFLQYGCLSFILPTECLFARTEIVNIYWSDCKNILVSGNVINDLVLLLSTIRFFRTIATNAIVLNER